MTTTPPSGSTRSTSAMPGSTPATSTPASERRPELVARPAGVGRSGRDRRHQSPRRSRHITAAFTDAEYAVLAEAARRVGLTPTGFCAQAALAATAPPAPGSTGPAAEAGGTSLVGADPRVEALRQAQADLAALRTAIVRVGTNLNQAVAALHARGEVPVWLRHVAEKCAAVLQTVDQTATLLHRRL
jgi:hypothetical protein